MIKKRKAIYEEIYYSLLEKIRNGKYSTGDALPSESELDKMFKVSRTPVRQALKQLENDGYIYRLQGKGSFVANYEPKGNWTLTTGFWSEENNDWKAISASTIEVQRIKDPYYASLLKLDEANEITHIKRLRKLYDEPMIYLEHYISPIVPFELFTKNPNFLSKDELIKRAIGVERLEINVTLETVLSASPVAELLKVEKYTPLLKGTRITKDQFSKNVMDVTIYFARTDKIKYKVNYEN
ncbi:hypothetical protein BTR23_18640 [Alkalihalophilus pseudofirmus]|nr:hypothetical protein BTR23_18640 [Alkalihalophilus pseudofirmus]